METYFSESEVKPCIYEYLNDNPSVYSSQNPFFKIVNDSLSFDFGGGEVMRSWHPHRDVEWRILPYTTIVVMDNSDVRYSVEIEEEGEIRIPQNNAMVIPAGKPFKFQLKETAKLANAHISYTILGNVDVLSFFKLPYLLNAPQSLEINKIVNDLAACNAVTSKKSIDIYNLIHMKQLAFYLLELLIHQGELQSDKIQKLVNLSKIQPVLSYINDHISEDINRKLLADVAHLSETRFHYVFKDIMEMSPMDYLRTLRLQYAQQKLLTTNDSIAEIARDVGIDNVFHFSKLFKSKFRMSPLHYRQLQNNSLFSPTPGE